MIKYYVTFSTGDRVESLIPLEVGNTVVYNTPTISLEETVDSFKVDLSNKTIEYFSV